MTAAGQRKITALRGGGVTLTETADEFLSPTGSPTRTPGAPKDLPVKLAGSFKVVCMTPTESAALAGPMPSSTLTSRWNRP